MRIGVNSDVRQIFKIRISRLPRYGWKRREPPRVQTVHHLMVTTKPISNGHDPRKKEEKQACVA